MRRYIRYGLAVIRGLLFQMTCIFRAGFSGGRKLLLCKNAEIMARSGGRVCLGDRVGIGRRSMLSALNGGRIDIGDQVAIGEDCRIVCHEEIRIGKGSLLAPGVMIYDHDHVFDKEHGVNKREFKTSGISIGENCWIAANVIILRGTHIGDRSVVGAGSVIKGSYPAGSVIVQKRSTEVYEVQ